MEKRLVLAIALSILIVLVFQYSAPRPPAVLKPEVSAPVANEPVKETEIAQIISPGEEEKETVIETDDYYITFSNIGGAIKAIELKKYKASGSTENLILVSLTNPAEYLLSVTSSSIPEINNKIYTGETKDGIITYTLTTNNCKIVKKYRLSKSLYGIELNMSIYNTSSATMPFSYKVIGGAGLKEVSNQDKRFVEVTSDINGKAQGFKKPKPLEHISHPGLVNWTALKNKYFSIILKPFVTTRTQFYSEDKSGMLLSGVDIETMDIQPGSFVENKFMLYAGPSNIADLKELGLGLEASVNYGFFGGISKVMIFIMSLFHTITRSWGFSIILLAVFLNIIMFPLTVKSFKSMQKMQELHPQMEQLKKQYKDAPDKLNKAIMELYKKYNINPLSGCLPILLQMPIFISLYSALMKSIELRNTSFYWIKDLSSPDAVRLPFTLPLIGNSINILPIIMVGAMVLQQRISTKTMGSAVTPEQKEQQKVMLIVMPIMFGFIFYGMPSGLVLYWVVNTLLTIAEQSAMVKNSQL